MAHVPAYGVDGNGIVSDDSGRLEAPAEPGVIEVPEFLLQPLAKVKSAVDKAMRKVRKGANLAELLDDYPLVDVSGQPDAVFRLWYSGKMPGPKPGFPIETGGFEQAFWHPKYDWNEQVAIRDEYLLEYLASSAWGTLILNSGQHAWYWKRGPDADAMATVLEATLFHWDTYIRLGRRFASLTTGVHTFPRATSAADGILMLSGYCADLFIPADEETLQAHPHLAPGNLIDQGIVRFPEVCRRERVIERLRTDAALRMRLGTEAGAEVSRAARARVLQEARAGGAG